LGSAKNAQVSFGTIRSGLNSNYISDMAYDLKDNLWVVGNNLNYLDFKSGADVQLKGGIIRRQYSGWEDVSALFGNFLKSTTESLTKLKGIYSDTEIFYLKLSVVCPYGHCSISQLNLPEFAMRNKKSA